LFGSEEAEPQYVVRPESQQIWEITNARKAELAPQLEREHALEFAQVKLDELREARKVVYAENRLVAIATQKHEHATIGGVERLPRSAPERFVLLADGDEPAHPTQQRRGQPLLRRDVDGVIAVRRI